MERPTYDRLILRPGRRPGQRPRAERVPLWRPWCLLVAFALVTVSGCGDEAGPTEAEPSYGLFVESIEPPSGSTIASPSLIRARLRYRLKDADSGLITLMLTCSVQGRPACFDLGTLTTLSNREGTADVAFAIGAPAGASISAGLRLVSDKQVPHNLVALSYHTAP